MLHGDLSNQSGITIGFRCIDFLVKYKENGVFNKVLNTVFGKVKRAEFDERVLHIMDYVYRQTEYNCDLVIEEKDYNEDLKNMLESNAPFNRVVLISKVSAIKSRLLVGDLSYYVDDDDYRRSIIGDSHVKKLDEIYVMLKRR